MKINVLRLQPRKEIYVYNYENMHVVKCSHTYFYCDKACATYEHCNHLINNTTTKATCSHPLISEEGLVGTRVCYLFLRGKV